MLIDSSLLFLIFLSGAILNFLPYFLGYSLRDPITNQYPDYLLALQGFKYGASMVASLATTIPILIDFAFDILFKSFSNNSPVTQSSLSITNIPFREIVFFLILPDCLLLFWILPMAQFDLVAPTICFRDTMYTYCFLSCMAKFENTIWTQTTTIMIGAPLMLCNVFLTSSVLLSNNDTFQAAYNVITPLLISVGLFSLIISILRWYRYFYLSGMRSSLSHGPNVESVRRKSDFLCTVYGTFLAIFLFGDWIVFYLPLPASSPWSVVGYEYLSMYNYLMAGCTLCMTVVLNHSARIEAANAKQMFMRYVSHELRTPLNVAFLGLKILYDELKPTGLPDLLLATLVDTQESCLVALDILNDMLLYDSISNGVMMLQKRSFDPVSFISRTLTPFRAQAREAGIELTVQQNVPADSSLQLYGDPHKLAQVIRNLVSNALKFTERGGSVVLTTAIQEEEEMDKGWVDVESGSSCRYCCASDCLCDWKDCWDCRKYTFAVMDVRCKLVVSVQDSGIGIPKVRQSSLFDGVVQFTPGTLQKGQGTGLGLYISKQILDLHGGKLSVHSMGDKAGSTFTVVLPLFPGSPSTSGAAGTAGREDALADSLPIEEVELTPPVSQKHSLIGPYAPIEPFTSPARLLGSQSYSSESSNYVSSSSQQQPFSESNTESRLCDIVSKSVENAATPAIPLSALVVDDSAMNRRMVCKILQASNKFRCDQAEDGCIAVEMVRRKIDGQTGQTCGDLDDGIKIDRYDLILMDYQMPNMDGPTAIAEIRRLGFTGLILGLTGNALPCDMDFMMSSGANGVLVKPLNMELFWDAIARFSQ